MKSLITSIYLLFISVSLFGQTAILTGKITDKQTGETIPSATVKLVNQETGVLADDKGKYTIEIPANQNVTVEFSFVNYKTLPLTLSLAADEKRKVNITLELEVGTEIVVKDRVKEREGEAVTVDVDELKLIPTVAMNLESVLPTFGLGVQSGTGGELTSQYSVRGGNYDENLVYVNDFEIYRPFLIRSGQQEGLTFPNMDLIRDLSFASGGFDAKYGDKMSSALNITYKRPTKTKASASISALGASAHVEGSIEKASDSTGAQRFRYLFGARYKTTRYLLGSLDLSGEYVPNFTDFQGLLTYDISEDWQVGVIGNFSSSSYQFAPEQLTTTLGLVNFALRFNVAFEGQEVDDFTTGMGGVSLTYLPNKSFFLKFLASAYQSQENERFDIIGQYQLGELETDLGSSELGEVVSILGNGTEQDFGRNYLTATVSNFEVKGGYEIENTFEDYPQKSTSHFMQWGVKFQNEQIIDELNEWERLDSAGYSLSYDTSQVLLNEVIKTNVDLSSNRFSAYFQNTYNFSDSVRDWSWTAGVRAQYWDLNGEFIVSPRTRLLYKPLKSKRDISYKLAAGLYFQPPFYRELRNLRGDVNTDVLAQKSLHIVAGYTYDFLIYKKKFRLISEAYFKRLWDLVPYDIDNVRIRYYGDNSATGYATGLDLRLNGEFVPGAESWINLSFLRARENITNVEHSIRTVGFPDSLIAVGTVPRPTDRFMAISVFFQDYLPQNENFKMHLNFTVGTGLPFGLPDNNLVSRNTYRYNPYHRVDIGFSALLWNEAWRNDKPEHFLRAFENVWLSLEFFNLMKVANVASNTWVRTVFNQQYAIPNRLTSRRVNLRLRVDI